jgi:enoyl-[acyl-carrier protein] reductase II
MKTRITELLGIKHPIIQGAMGWISGPNLVAAVSNAGGLGILAAVFWSPSNLKTNIHLTRELTDKPFGVNFTPDHPHLEEMIDVLIEEKIPVASYGIGNPKRLIERCKPAGILCLPTVGSMKHTIRAEQDGAGAVICQGTEGGGSTGYFALMSFIPQAVDRVKIPVIAAGGISDGRGLAAALVLGAEGIEMGTRFMVTQESPAHADVKRKILESEGEDAIAAISMHGLQARFLSGQNISADELRKKGDELKVGGRRLFDPLVAKLGKKALMDGDLTEGNIAAGQGVGLIRDIPTCRELIERIVSEAETILRRTVVKVSA